MKSGTIIDVSVDKISSRGNGIASYNGFNIEIPKTIPGDIVKVKLSNKKKNRFKGEITKIIRESPEALIPKCPHVWECGSCSLQRLHYSKQLEFKHSLVRHILESNDLYHEITVHPCDELFYYRNKMEYSFSDRIIDEYGTLITDDVIGLGFHPKNRNYVVFNIEQCSIAPEKFVRIVKIIRDRAAKSTLPAYNLKKHCGFWRYLVVRMGINTNNLMVNIVTTGEKSFKAEVLNDLKKSMKEAGVTSFIHSINNGFSNCAISEEQQVVFGDSYYREELNDTKFKIYPYAFFQTNVEMFRKLITELLTCVKLTEEDIVYDLYSGVGTISLSLAHTCRRVVGFELIREAVDSARQNSTLNNSDNCVFIECDLKNIFLDSSYVVRKYGYPRVLITDPPRAGMHKKVIKGIMKILPEIIIYISCNPKSLGRDLSFLRENYYIAKTQIFDFFPQTHHIETMVKLVRSR